MSRMERTSVFTKKLFELEEAIEKGDKKEFQKKLEEHSLSLHNCSVGDTKLSDKYNAILRKALDKFM
ncbi:MAG TPA: hypothetical protein DHM42_06125 [Clostridiales bacterium]|nr:hypothetical protein [Clostridiales bacterium]